MGKIKRTIKRATTSKRYNLLGLFKSSGDKTSIEVTNENNIQWWEADDKLIEKFETIEAARQYLQNLLETHDNLIGYFIEREYSSSPVHIEVYDSKTAFLAEYDDHFMLRLKVNKDHNPCCFTKGEKVLAYIPSPYFAIVPCIVVGKITETSEREDWEMNDPKDYYSTYEDYVKDWDDWHWDFMEVQPLVKLKSPKWGYKMTDTITVPRIYLFPMATE